MGRSKDSTSNLEVVRMLCEDLETFFEAFIMDKVWSNDGKKVTVCFTAERIKAAPKAKQQLVEPFRY